MEDAALAILMVATELIQVEDLDRVSVVAVVVWLPMLQVELKIQVVLVEVGIATHSALVVF